jgi:DNA (cytosine-5)-methyltransferase 1
MRKYVRGGVLDLSYPDSKTRRGRVIDNGDTSPTLNTNGNVGVIQVGQIYGTEKEPNPQAGRVYSDQGISPCLDAMRGGNRQPKIFVKPCLTPDREHKRQNGRRFKEDGEEMFTLTAQDKHGVLLDDGRTVRIRRLTPKECFRLQGWTDDYFEKAAFVNSDSQLYKQAGNGVTVNVIYEIAKGMATDD